ncbi:MAG: response regulator [Candidatus Eremiobacteraeota bacterium]|nr:response regulator [Candidatus Eremiobacteraeota bacterium]
MPRVIIADDARFMRLMLRDILERNGFEVVGEAENGAEALSLFRELRPDLVTLDIVMPGFDGLTALKAIMAHDKDACVVMVSAMGQLPFIEEAMASGAKGYIVKPFSPAKVLETIYKVMKIEKKSEDEENEGENSEPLSSQE